MLLRNHRQNTSTRNLEACVDIFLRENKKIIVILMEMMFGLVYHKIPQK